MESELEKTLRRYRESGFDGLRESRWSESLLRNRLSGLEGVNIDLSGFRTGGVRMNEFGYFTMDSAPRPEPQRVSAKQIHEEVYAECATLLENPGQFEMTEPEKSDRVATLEEMGFLRHPDLAEYNTARTEYNNKKLQHHVSRNVYTNALKYSLRYPNYKFITSERLEKVCSKYGLVTKEVGLYKGDIPEQNIKEMRAFHKSVVINESDVAEGDGGYMISAPPKEFADFRPQMSTWERWLLEDPIVLKPVKDGYLIVSAWGDEATDPDVLNERNN